jgi:hypothetical protein
MPPDPSEYRPTPPPDMSNFPAGGLCITIDKEAFDKFLEDLDKEEK